MTALSAKSTTGKYFQKNLQIGLGHFLWPSITDLNEKIE